MRSTLSQRLLLAALISLAAGVRLWHSNWGLPLLLHPDEWSQVDVAARVAAGNPNPHFFRYPSGTIYMQAALLAVAERLYGSLAVPERYLLARCVTALVGAATVWLVWRWALLLLPQSWAPGAAGLLALLPSHVIHSHYATVDVPLTLLFALCGYALTRLALAAPEQRRRRALLAACCVGLALGVKYTAALLLLPLLVLVIGSPQQPAVSRRSPLLLAIVGLALIASAALFRLNMPRIIALAERMTTDGRLEREYRGLLEFVFWAGLGGGLALLALARPRWERQAQALLDPQPWRCLLAAGLVFLGSSPFVLLDYRHAMVDIFYEYRHAVAGAEAHFPEDSGLAIRAAPADNAALYAGQLGADFGPALPLVALGLLLCLRRGRLWIALALPPVLLLATLLRAGNASERYLLPIYPALCLLAALALRALWQRLPALRQWRALGAALPAALVAGGLYGQLTLFGLPDTRSLAYAWAARHLPPGSTVANENYTQTPDLRGLPMQQLLANRSFDPAVRWETRADYLLLGSRLQGALPAAIAELSARYGPPLMVITPTPGRSRGPSLYLFKLSSR
jgi:4-amino-4-deoxy-L-arabinose transferase-like glycosyltransferase